MIFEDVAGYIADHDWCLKTIDTALSADDPEEYLEDLLGRSNSTRAADIRIILNRFRRS